MLSVPPILLAARLPYILWQSPEGEIKITTLEPIHDLESIQNRLNTSWSSWSQWMEAYYPQWLAHVRSSSLHPWTVIPLNPNPNASSHLVKFDAIAENADELFFRAFLLAQPNSASVWWRETTIQALLQMKNTDNLLPKPRPLNIPLGTNQTTLFAYDALFLRWIESLDPDEWLADLWGRSTERLHDLVPALDYLRSRNLDSANWLSGYFLHWAAQSPPQSFPSSPGTMVMPPLAAARLDLPGNSTERGAWKVEMYFDHDLPGNVWILGFPAQGPPDLFSQPIDTRKTDVVLPSQSYLYYSIILINTSSQPWDPPVNVRWSADFRSDYPFVLLGASLETLPTGYQITWETAVEFQTQSWWIEEWDDATSTWRPLHATGIPAGQHYFFPLKYAWVFTFHEKRTTPPKFRILCKLSSGQRIPAAYLTP